MDTATSDHADATSKPQLAINSEYEDVVKRRLEDGKGAGRCENRENNIGSSAIASYGKVSDARNEDVGLITRTEKGDESVVDRHENSDIIYSQDLIVRNISTTYSQRSTTDEVFNFKCFRKAGFFIRLIIHEPTRYFLLVGNLSRSIFVILLIDFS